MQIKTTVKNPFFWFLLLFIGYSTFKNLNELSNVITSDGRGYYAYLPAYFLHGNFEKSFFSEGIVISISPIKLLTALFIKKIVLLFPYFAL